MKAVAICLLLCSYHDSQVISADGNELLEYCSDSNMQCIEKFCPNGAYTLLNKKDHDHYPDVVRCFSSDGGR